MFRNATIKLTAYYLAIVMAISLLFSLILYNVTSDELARSLHRQSDRFFQQFPGAGLPPQQPDQGLLETGEHHLLLQLVLFNVLVLVAAGLTSYLLARRTLAPIEEAHEQQKRFTADVSHELRTPLTALRMESEVALLDKSATLTALRSTLTSNIEEVGKMEVLINSLLRLTKLENGELEQSFTTLKTADLVGQAIERLAKKAKHHKVDVTVGGKSYYVQGDAENLTQLLVILLDNAIKYSPVGSPVTVKTKTSDNHISIIIKDEGAGIEPDALEHIFDRFYRADQARTNSATDGYGLGLSIAKTIADLHHATIEIASQPGKGTTATLKLPITIV